MAEGDTTTTTTTTAPTTTTTAPPPASWTASLPEPIRGNEAWKDVPDVGTLATRYLETRKPFAEQLPEKIRGEAAFKDIKSLDALADSFFNAQKMLGVPKDQLLRLPADDKPESWAPIWDKLGRPAKSEDYKLTVPQGETVEPEFAKSLFAKAHELGVGNKQLDGLYGWLREQGVAKVARDEAAASAAADQTRAALKTEWGQAYDQKIGDGIVAVDFLETKYPGLKADLDASKLGNHPAMAKFMADYAAAMREDGKIVGRGQGTGGMKSPAEALQEINALSGDPVFQAKYLNKNHPGHKDAVEQMFALRQLAHPEPQRQAG